MWKLVCLALILGLSLPSADAGAASCDYCNVYNAIKNNLANINTVVGNGIAAGLLDFKLNVGLPGLLR
ncbi:hypothetical protein FKM82_025289 [Ascaphus truei]